MRAYLNALTGKGVHVVTVNDYLAKYQSEMMGRIHHFLGLSVDVILPEMRPAERRVAYSADAEPVRVDPKPGCQRMSWDGVKL